MEETGLSDSGDTDELSAEKTGSGGRAWPGSSRVGTWKLDAQPQAPGHLRSRQLEPQGRAGSQVDCRVEGSRSLGWGEKGVGDLVTGSLGGHK